MKDKTAPAWLRIVAYFFAFMAFLVSFTLLFAPAGVLENVDLNAKGVDYLIQMWAARQFAMGCIFFYGAVKKQIALILQAVLFFLVMNLGDFLIGLAQKDNGLIIGAMVMCVLSGLILLLTDKNKTDSTRAS